MRILISILIFFLLFSCTKTEPTQLKNFHGVLKFSELKYDLEQNLISKDLLIYSILNHQVQISHIDLDDTPDTIKYLPIVFKNINNIVNVCYYNSIKSKNDSLPLFSTVKGRNMMGLEKYLLKVDSSFEYHSDESIDFSHLEIPITFGPSTNIGDSSLNFSDVKVNCYRYLHEQKDLPTWGGIVDIKEVVFVEKESLLPIKRIVYLRRYKDNNWIKTYETVLISMQSK